MQEDPNTTRISLEDLVSRKYGESKEVRVARADAWNKANPEKYREYARKSLLKGKFDMTPEDYDTLLTSQDGTCAICDGECSTGRRLAVDHDHDTGENRGLLCVSCNTKLGWFELNRKNVEDYLV